MLITRYLTRHIFNNHQVVCFLIGFIYNSNKMFGIQIKCRNITPNQRELAVLQLPPEGIKNQAPPQYSDSSDDDLDDEINDTNDDPREGSCDDKDSEDDFQAPPPQAVKVKRKGNVGSSTAPVRKRTKKLVTGGS